MSISTRRNSQKKSKALCASNPSSAVIAQQSRKTISNVLVLPRQSSRKKFCCQRSYFKRHKHHVESQEETSSNSSSSGGEDISLNYNNVPCRINERLRCIGFNKRRPSFSDTESVLEFVKMPVGSTTSLIKSSFSLTSLGSYTPTDGPDNYPSHRLKTERPYHSLTKKYRKGNEQNKELWRKSWGSGISQDGKEFWEEFQADYDYLMAQNILERDISQMQIGNSTKSTPTAPPVWSHSEFLNHFAQLYSWLKGIQDSVYGKQENVTDWKLRAERQEDMQRQRFRLDNFNEESKNLISRYPEIEGEVLWRVKHINDKWETVDAMMGGSKKREGEERSSMGSRDKVKHEVKCLRKWLRELDNKLKPLTFQQGWTKAELEIKAKEHMVLHRDIEGHIKIVSSVLKLCEKSDAARALERKYHEYYLRSLEWKYHLEDLVGLQLNKSPSTLSNDSDGEPVAKIARFTYPQNSDKSDNDGDDLRSNEESIKDEDCSMDTSINTKEEIQDKAAEDFTGNTMVGSKVKGSSESILGSEDSASVLGSRSRNANIFFSCANSATDSRSLLKSPKSPTASLNNELIKKDFAQLKDQNTAAEPETNRSKGKPPNTGTFTWRHLDTDSEQEKIIMSGKEKKTKKDVVDGKDIETTSSEDGWTYFSGNKTETEVQKPKAAVRLDFKESESPKENRNSKQTKYFSAKNIPRSNSVKMLNSKEPISSSNRKLMDLADELVRCKSKPWKSRRSKVKKGDETKPLDSCDASGEYTSEDSEQSESSEDNDGSVATCRRSGSAEGILEDTSVVKSSRLDFLRRTPRHALRLRPWSMSSVSWLRTPRGQNLKTRSSVSESALNQMMDHLDKEKSREFYLSSGKKISGEEGSVRRRTRAKIRKRMNKKSDSGSDALTLSGSDSAKRSSPSKHIVNFSGLVKSGSFSGVSKRQRDFSPFYKYSSGGGSETDEETTGLIPPAFRVGPTAGVVTVACEQEKSQGEEQLSLNWDNYQDKYQSEAYSEEPPDSDTAKKLLEFGEDYGKFLGNQSDSASTRSRSIIGRNRSKVDSDSDVDEVRKIVRQSHDQLDLWEMKFNKKIGGLMSTNDVVFDEFTSKNFFDEIIAACRRNVDCLTKLLDEVKDEIFLAKEQKCIQSIKDSWESLKSTAELHKAKQLQREITLLKDELLTLAANVDSMETTVTSKEELEAKISWVENELNLLKKGKCKLLQANVSVHRFLSAAKNIEPNLKDEVTELYQVWDQTFGRVSTQLFNLQSLSQTWHDFEDHLSQLQCALRTDTLKVLDFALKCGTPSTDMAFSLQDIAGILSDRDTESKRSVQMVQGGAGENLSILPSLSTEGSLSDSGISDSGSEQELSEREKRLAQLKRLAKRLESILAPGSQALSNMFNRIDQAESELRELQKTCRDLIVRSASSEEFKAIIAKTSSLSSLSEELSNCPAAKSSGKKDVAKLRQKSEDETKSEDTCEDVENENSNKSGKKCWFWRLLRFALPFQLALVALLCVACMIEPRCCDSLNNLDLSLNPQLRYDSGPPPV